VYFPAKPREKLDYMHANPVKANLQGLLQIDRWGASSEQREITERPTLCKNRKE
jgi:hypothetical protein